MKLRQVFTFIAAFIFFTGSLAASETLRRYNDALQLYRSQSIPRMRRVAESRLAAEPGNAQALMLLEKVEVFEGRLEKLYDALKGEASTNLKDGSYKSAEEKAEVLLEFKPNDSSVGRILEEALKGESSPVFPEKPQDIKEATEEDSELNFQVKVGYEYLSSGDLYGAKVIAESLMELYPGNSQVIGLKEKYDSEIASYISDADSLLRSGNREAALEKASIVLEIDPFNAEALRINERARDAGREIDDALAEFSQYIYAGKLKEASDTLNFLMDKSPNSASVQNAAKDLEETFQIELERLRRYFESRRISEAAELASYLQGIFPEDKGLKALSSEISQALDRINEAISEAFAEAELAYKNKDIAKAKRELDMLLVSNPLHAGALELMNKILEEEEQTARFFEDIETEIYARRFRNAQQLIDSAVERYPGDERLDSSKSLLDQEIKKLLDDAKYYERNMEFEIASELVGILLESYPEMSQAILLKDRMRDAIFFIADRKKAAYEEIEAFAIDKAWDIFDELNFAYSGLSEIEELRVDIKNAENRIIRELNTADKELVKAYELYATRNYNSAYDMLEGILSIEIVKEAGFLENEKSSTTAVATPSGVLGYLDNYKRAEDLITDYEMQAAYELLKSIYSSETVPDGVRFNSVLLGAFSLNFLEKEVLAYSELTSVMREINDYDRSIENFPMYISLDPSFMELYETVSSNMQYHTDYLSGRALEMFKEASSLKAQVGEIYDRLRKAEEDFYTRAHNLADQYFNRGDMFSALNSLSDIFRFDPSNERARTLYEKALEGLAGQLRIPAGEDRETLREAVNEYNNTNFKNAIRLLRRLSKYERQSIDELIKRAEVHSGESKNRSKAARELSTAEQYIEDNYLRRAEESVVNAVMLDRNNLKAELLLEEIRYRQGR